MFSPSLALGLCLVAVSAVQAAIFDLSELQWTLRSANGSVEVPGAVPSHAHLDLLRAGIITEPNLGINGEIYALSPPQFLHRAPANLS